MRMDSCIWDDFNQFSAIVFEEHKKMRWFAGFLAASIVVAVHSTNFLGIYGGNNIDPLNPYELESPYATNFRRRCPLCDSSVYSYCSDKLFHDSCCCHNPNNPYDQRPYQCVFADCKFLHANSCQEHKLITACCCTNIYFKK